MSSTATYGEVFARTDKTESSSSISSWIQNIETTSVKEIGISIVLHEKDFDLLDERHHPKANHHSTAYLGEVAFHYYPISATVSALMALLGSIGLVTFVSGLHDQFFLSLWILLIGAGMFRTLYIAGAERRKLSEDRLRDK